MTNPDHPTEPDDTAHADEPDDVDTGRSDSSAHDPTAHRRNRPSGRRGQSVADMFIANASTYGTLLIQSDTRDIRWRMNGSDALALLDRFLNPPAVSDSLSPARDSARDHISVISFGHVVALQWIPETDTQ